MSMPTVIAIALVAGLGATQYILMVQALRDLSLRPRVRGDNKVAWGLFILCVPIIGPLVYGWMGPASLIRRPQQTPEIQAAPRTPPVNGQVAARRNITPISEARRRSTLEGTPTDDPNRPAVRRYRRTGS